MLQRSPAIRFADAEMQLRLFTRALALALAPALAPLARFHLRPGSPLSLSPLPSPSLSVPLLPVCSRLVSLCASLASPSLCLPLPPSLLFLFVSLSPFVGLLPPPPQLLPLALFQPPSLPLFIPSSSSLLPSSSLPAVQSCLSTVPQSRRTTAGTYSQRIIRVYSFTALITARPWHTGGSRGDA
jgi:hypothetical protein